MLVQFCTFTTDNNEEVRVNAWQVRCIKMVAHAGPPAETWSRLEFDQNHYIIVKAKPSDVERGLTTDDE
jgi:hypothetical protein